MAARKDYYFRQKVTEAELDAGFAGLEAADWQLAIDHGLVGIASGGAPSQHAGTPNLTIDVQGPCAAYDKSGRRIGFSALQNVDVSVDDNALTTAVSGVGNQKWVSVFLVFDRLLSDPRIDGNSLTVFFDRAESFEFSVVQGGEAAIGVATRPPLDSGKILVCDIDRRNGQTQILNADLFADRREDVMRSTAGTVDVIAGTWKDAIQDILTELNVHIDGSGHNHDATVIEFGGNTAAWADASSLVATFVFNAIEEIVGTLGASTASDDGAEKVGAESVAGSPTSLSTGSVRSQLSALLTAVNARVLKAGDTMSGSLTLSGAADAIYDSNRNVDLQISLAGAIPSFSAGVIDWVVFDSPGVFAIRWSSQIASRFLYFPINHYLRTGMVINVVAALVDPVAANSTDADQMQVALVYTTPDYTTPADPTETVVTSQLDDETGNLQQILITGIAHTVARQNRNYMIRIRAANEAGGDLVHGVRMQIAVPGPPVG